MPNQPKTKAHTVRVDDELWEAAAAEANRRGESLSEAVRKFLKRYAATPATSIGQPPQFNQMQRVQ